MYRVWKLAESWNVDGEQSYGISVAIHSAQRLICRSGMSAIGLILGSVVSAGKQRLILLRQSGEIWPVGMNDVQFIMPPSLIPPHLSERCWSTDLLEQWAKGEEEIGGEEADLEMMQARREVVVILRKVGRETEKMEARLSAPGRSGRGGVEAVWESWVEAKGAEERGSITAREAAEFMLAAQTDDKTSTPIKVRDNTLPAFAAHRMLMRRPDLFVADEGEMWDSGVFLVRSKGERQRLQEVSRWVNGETEADKAVLQSFIDKARAALTSDTKTATEWTESDQTIIHTLFIRLYETRTTQHSPSDRLSVSILRALDPYPGGLADQALIARLLFDLGCLPAADSLQTSKSIEAERREMSLHPGPISSSRTHSSDLFKGSELDSVRQDLSSHRVWVIDDPGAKELDDGISISRIPGSEDVRVHIHIADPTRILPLDHPLAIQASFRGSALYLPEGNTPLFHLDDVMRSMSLGAMDTVSGEQGQAVMTFSARLSHRGEVMDTDVQLGWIKQPRITTYGAVDAAFGIQSSMPSRPFGAITSETRKERGEPIEASEMPELDLLRSTATARRQHRLEQGGIEWSLPSGSVHLIDPSKPASNVFDRTIIPSQSLPSSPPIIDYTVPAVTAPVMTASSAVAEMMMLTGRISAQFCINHGIPIPYRGAEAPQQLHLPGRPGETMSVEDLLALRDANGSIDPYVVWKSRVVFPPSTVTTDPRIHWNMGFTGDERGYTRATSPLRRYDDLLVHWQIKSQLARMKNMSWGEILEEQEVAVLAKRSEEAQRRVKRASISAEKYWQAGLFASKLQGPVSGEEGVADLREGLTARIAGPSTAMRGKVTTPVHIPVLGALAKMSSGSVSWDIGEEVQVRMVNAVQWPAPLVEVVPV